jgi:hypothetical protein
MTMASKETSGDPSASGTVVVGIVGAVLVLVAIVAMQALFYNAESAETYNKQYRESPQGLTQLRTGQLEQLNSYRWIDQKQGVAAIPIDRAMELVVHDLAAGRDPVATQPAQTP